MTEQELNRLLDKTVGKVFQNDNAAFLGSLYCSLQFKWDHTRPDQVATDYTAIWWGPKDFLDCTPEERESTLLHEIWHNGLLHNIRRGTRDPLLWNIACDYRINNDLRRNGRFIPDTWVVDPRIDDKGIMAEEDIYDLLCKKALKIPANYQHFDLLSEPKDAVNTITAVVRAVQAAELAGKAGLLPGSIRTTLDTFLNPVIPWRTVLMQWMTDLLDEDFSWKRPNRRYLDDGLYLPSRELDEGRLEHLVYFLDVSGSITDKDAQRFNSEVKYVQEVLQPKKLTLVQFDTAIQDVREFTEHDRFDELEIIGRGGTCLVCVHDYIEKHKPTAAIIFSDLECSPMKKLSEPIPVIWAVIRNHTAWVPFGKVIHIND